MRSFYGIVERTAQLPVGHLYYHVTVELRGRVKDASWDPESPLRWSVIKVVEEDADQEVATLLSPAAATLNPEVFKALLAWIGEQPPENDFRTADEVARILARVS